MDTTRKVSFDELPRIIYIDHDESWPEEDYKNARKSDWATVALDKERFNRRISEFEVLYKCIMVSARSVIVS